ncbi:hypothetical protein WR25_21958 [Diploscapter pachys]|uniref:Uncharacterized protein n=1 Tax=Diploscapter pachys TaxID=2018661 RepID=A0A2A2K514_9BILA|nr:hypothetical protein WR25_21958 [Diploscapter pachys]
MFEYALPEDGEDLQAKLHALNQIIEDQVVLNGHQRAPLNHSGISEDSDYTSDVSFPIHQQQANSSAHQWDSHLHPHRNSSSTLRRNDNGHQRDTASYEDEEDAYYTRPYSNGNGQTDGAYDHHQGPMRQDQGGDGHTYDYDNDQMDQYGYTNGEYDMHDEYGRAGGSRHENLNTADGHLISHNERDKDYEGVGYTVEHDQPSYVYPEDEYPDEYYPERAIRSEEEEYGQGASGTKENDVRQHHDEFANESWNENDPLSYNSRPPSHYLDQRRSQYSWRDDRAEDEDHLPGTSDAPQQSILPNDVHSQDEMHDYFGTTDPDKSNGIVDHNYDSDQIVERRYDSVPSELIERRYDSDHQHQPNFYYDEFDMTHNQPSGQQRSWRYDSIQEEDADREHWREEEEERAREWRRREQAERNQWQGQDNQRQGPHHDADSEMQEADDQLGPLQHGNLAHETIQEEDERRSARDLWIWAYKQVCKNLGFKLRRAEMSREEGVPIRVRKMKTL